MNPELRLAGLSGLRRIRSEGLGNEADRKVGYDDHCMMVKSENILPARLEIKKTQLRLVNGAEM